MRFNQAFEVLDHLIDVYEAISMACERLLDETETERSRMLLHYLIQKQRENIQYIRDIKLRMPESLLNTWIDEDIEKSIISATKDIHVASNVKTHELMEHVDTLHENIIVWLNVTTNVIPNQDLLIQLQNITDSLNQRHRQLAQAVNRMDDM
ncbi:MULTISPECIES: hypothetical protein [Shewanella]|uniref:DUF2383 domain-containing protein n=3 Tax=Shewanella TaxID=22 RepID=A0ABN4Y968_9GAMM|nr:MULTISPECIES: hypothetical protein [Shewanella]ARD20471.1 hypothetical protein SJ2017_0122 [Shewanella japonica]MBQ4890296.1 hypothetical protein [Shewanella sp. MMG014]OBT05465.1 hypothetical protein A9267_16575 [Shewanella sp. UCD-FRSSP16_17]